MMRRSSNIIIIMSLFIVVGVACEPVTPASLTVQAPARISQAQTSTNTSLCEAIVVDLTLDASNLSAAAVDRERLVAKQDTPCTWVLGEPTELIEGRYDLIVRFEVAVPPSACGARAVLLGAFVRRDLEFPWSDDFEGLTPDDFLSRVADAERFVDLGLHFDNDDDGIDNLLELASGTDPCVVDTPPSLTLSAADGAEGEPITLALTTSADSLPPTAFVELAISHGNDISTRPEYHTTTISIRSPGGPADITPNAIDRPQRERWSVSAAAPVGGTWILVFVPEEPFVGELTLGAVIDDGFGEEIAATGTTIAVIDINDPPTFIYQVGDREEILAVVPFAEIPPTDVVYPYRPEGANEPTVRSFRFVDDDLTPAGGSGPSAWRPELRANDIGVTMSTMSPGWALHWSPTNQQVLDEPLGGYRVTVDIIDTTNEEQVDEVEVGLAISPLWNDWPWYQPPAIGQRALPASPFAQHVMEIRVTDPDEVNSAPVCAVSVVADESTGTTCTAPFADVLCQAVGTRQGAVWTYEITLIPTADYFVDCGLAPAFAATVMLTDFAPPGAANDAIEVGRWCEATYAWGECAPAAAASFALRTLSLVIPTQVTGMPVYTTSRSAGRPILLHGPGAVGATQITVDGTTGVYLLDLDPVEMMPEVAYEFEPDVLCNLHNERRFGTVDEVNNRMLLAGRRDTGTGCTSGERALVLIDLPADPADLADPTFTTFGIEEFCDGTWRPDYVTDSLGRIWLACDSDGGLARIDVDGTVTKELVPEYSNSGGASFLAEIIADAGGKDWLVWPDNQGILLVDLSTFDGDSAVSPACLRVGSAAVGESWMVDAVADRTRHAFLFAFVPTSNDVSLYRVRVGPSPQLDGPLDLGVTDTLDRSRLILRIAGNEPPAEVDLVVTRGGSADPGPHIDLESWTLVATRSDYALGLGAGLLPSPDRRVYVGPTDCATAECYNGMFTFTWDPLEPGAFINMGSVPTGGDWMEFTISRSGFMMANAPGSNPIEIYYFPEAAQGLDE